MDSKKDVLRHAASGTEFPSIADELSLLQRRRLSSALTGLPAHLLGGGLRRQAEQRTLQHLGRARRAAEAYRPHLRAAATAALTAARKAGPGNAYDTTSSFMPDYNANAGPEPSAESRAWLSLYDACMTRMLRLLRHHTEVRAWEGQERARREEAERRARLASLRRPSRQRQAASAAAAAAVKAEIPAAAPQPVLDPELKELLLRNLTSRIGAFDVYGIVDRLLTAAPSAAQAGLGRGDENEPAGRPTEPELNGGGGDGNDERGCGGSNRPGGGAAASESVLQGMCLEATPADSPHAGCYTAAAGVDPGAAGLPARALLLIRCLVDAWEGEPGMSTGGETWLDAASALADALVQYYGGPTLTHTELLALAILLARLHHDAVALLLDAGIGRPFTGPTCHFEGACGATTTIFLLCRIAQAIAYPAPPPLPSPAGADTGGAATAAAGVTALTSAAWPGPLTLDHLWLVADEVPVVLLQATRGLRPDDPWVRVAAAVRGNAAPGVRENERALAIIRERVVAAEAAAASGGSLFCVGPDGAHREEDPKQSRQMLPVIISMRDIYKWLRDEAMGGVGGSAGGGGAMAVRDDSVRKQGAEHQRRLGHAEAAEAGGSGGGGGAWVGVGVDETHVLRSWELGRLAVRAEVARALLTADGGQEASVTVAGGGAMLAVLAAALRLGELRVGTQEFLTELLNAEAAGAGGAGVPRPSNADCAVDGSDAGSGKPRAGCCRESDVAHRGMRHRVFQGPIVLQPEIVPDHALYAEKGCAPSGPNAIPSAGTADSAAPAVRLTLLAGDPSLEERKETALANTAVRGRGLLVVAPGGAHGPLRDVLCAELLLRLAAPGAALVAPARSGGVEAVRETLTVLAEFRATLRKSGRDCVLLPIMLPGAGDQPAFSARAVGTVGAAAWQTEAQAVAAEAEAEAAEARLRWLERRALRAASEELLRATLCAREDKKDGERSGGGTGEGGRTGGAGIHEYAAEGRSSGSSSCGASKTHAGGDAGSCGAGPPAGAPAPEHCTAGAEQSSADEDDVCLQAHWPLRRRSAVNKVLCGWLGLLPAPSAKAEAAEARGRRRIREGWPLEPGALLGFVGFLVVECDPRDPSSILPPPGL